MLLWRNNGNTIGQGVVNFTEATVCYNNSFFGGGSRADVGAHSHRPRVIWCIFLQRGWAWWCAGAALNVGNMIVI